MRNILLLEPNYQNKYPPIGLMKIATYHRILGDSVTFFKGDLNAFVIDQIYLECVGKLKRIEKSIHWQKKATIIKEYIKRKHEKLLYDLGFQDSTFAPLIEKCLAHYADYYRKKEYKKNPKYDRIYVTTLFTFYWKITIETIHFAKALVKDQNQLLVGGVMASLLTKEIELETGIKPMTGLLDKPGVLDTGRKAKKIIIDDLPLDYSILYEVDYEYPTDSAYFTFMTKGCTRKCSFCSVPKLEPTYKPKIATIDKFREVRNRFGEQQNLLLMDNNVLASPNFPEIVDEIKEMGFSNGATYVEPNQLRIAMRMLRSGYNDRGYVRRAYNLIHQLLNRLKGPVKQELYDRLEEFELLDLATVTKSNLLKANKHIGPMYERYRSKGVRQRYVDFNQGTDARYYNEDVMRLMSEIPIKPLRIAFDYIGLKDKYVKAIELAAKYGKTELSNYILYNFNDAPSELYERLRINVDLNERLSINIYSFPMKYIPLFGEDAKGRDYVGKKWNRKFIRAIQSILNVTKGIVAPGRDFFEKAFGRDLEEFRELLYMPETYIIYRHLFEKVGYTQIWRDEYRSLTLNEREEAQKLIETNNFTMLEDRTSNERVRNFLRHYGISMKHLEGRDSEYRKLKRQYDKIIRNNQHHNLTLTYDFETPVKRRKHSLLV